MKKHPGAPGQNLVSLVETFYFHLFFKHYRAIQLKYIAKQLRASLPYQLIMDCLIIL